MEASDAMLIHANSRNWQAYRPVETVSLEGGVQNTAVMHLPKRHATR